MLVIGFYRELLIKCIESEENGCHDNDSNDRKVSLDLLHTEQRERMRDGSGIYGRNGLDVS